MDFHQKQSVYQELKGQQFLEADRALLGILRPSSKVLKGLKNPDRSLVQEKILWELLDVADQDRILRNRQEESGKTLFGSMPIVTTDPIPEDKKKSPNPIRTAKDSKEHSSKGSRVPKH